MFGSARGYFAGDALGLGQLSWEAHAPMLSQIIYPRFLLQSSDDAAGRFLLAPQGKMLNGAPVITQNLRP